MRLENAKMANMPLAPLNGLLNASTQGPNIASDRKHPLSDAIFQAMWPDKYPIYSNSNTPFSGSPDCGKLVSIDKQFTNKDCEVLCAETESCAYITAIEDECYGDWIYGNPFVVTDNNTLLNNIATVIDCQTACQESDLCDYFTFFEGECAFSRMSTAELAISTKLIGISADSLCQQERNCHHKIPINMADLGCDDNFIQKCVEDTESCKSCPSDILPSCARRDSSISMGPKHCGSDTAWISKRNHCTDSIQGIKELLDLSPATVTECSLALTSLTKDVNRCKSVCNRVFHALGNSCHGTDGTTMAQCIANRYPLMCSMKTLNDHSPDSYSVDEEGGAVLDENNADPITDPIIEELTTLSANTDDTTGSIVTETVADETHSSTNTTEESDNTVGIVIGTACAGVVVAGASAASVYFVKKKKQDNKDLDGRSLSHSSISYEDPSLEAPNENDHEMQMIYGEVDATLFK